MAPFPNKKTPSKARNKCWHSKYCQFIKKMYFPKILRYYRMRALGRRKTIALLALILFGAIVALVVYMRLPEKVHNHVYEPRVVLWWTSSMTPDYLENRFCGMDMCTFTSQRKYRDEAKAILFYGSNIERDDLPLPRSPYELWALLHEESPRNVPYLPYVLQHFNFTSTFSRYSDFPLTTQYLGDPRDLTSPKYLVSIGEKAAWRMDLAPVAYLQSNCDSASGRDEYVRELMQHIRIDSYGKCLHNADLPHDLDKDYLNKLDAPALYRHLSRYKFIIAYENGVCHDYISEKFWRPLILGSIPIYFGSPTIRDWVPNNKSVIYIDDFASPKDLADLIYELDGDDVKYLSYLQHKYNQYEPISNERLKRELFTRHFANTPQQQFFAEFECAVCKAMISLMSDEVKMATQAHYNCPLPIHVPRMNSTLKETDVWQSIMRTGRCEAELLDELWRKNENYTRETYNKLLLQKFKSSSCNEKK